MLPVVGELSQVQVSVGERFPSEVEELQLDPLPEWGQRLSEHQRLVPLRVQSQVAHVRLGLHTHTRTRTIVMVVVEDLCLQCDTCTAEEEVVLTVHPAKDMDTKGLTLAEDCGNAEILSAL